ncbi:hypothetical protein Tco_1098270 [Tanacetum coccineum]
MSSSTVTYTSVYTDSKPGRVYWGSGEEQSDVGSLGVIVYKYDGLPMHPASKDKDDARNEGGAPSSDQISSAVPVVDPVPSARDTKAFETDESALHTSPKSPSDYCTTLPDLTPTDIPEAEMPPRKRAYFTTPALRVEVEEISAAGAARQLGPTLKVDLRRDRVGRRTLRSSRCDSRMHKTTRLFESPSQHTIQRQECSYRGPCQDTRGTGSLTAQTSSLQTQLTTTLGRIETLEARDLEPHDEPAEAGSSC